MQNYIKERFKRKKKKTKGKRSCRTTKTQLTLSRMNVVKIKETVGKQDVMPRKTILRSTMEMSTHVFFYFLSIMGCQSASCIQVLRIDCLGLKALH